MYFCAFCGEPCPTAYRIIDVANNKAISEYHLCTTCGETYIEAVFTPKAETPHKIIPQSNDKSMTIQIQVITSAAELLATLLGKTMTPAVVPGKTTGHPPCPKCGHTLENLQTRGKFGCAYCYTHFDDTIVPIVEMAQKNAKKHVGKSPKNLAVIPDEENYAPDPEKIKALKLKGLKAKMARELKHERYEQAAKLRDQIKAFESESQL